MNINLQFTKFHKAHPEVWNLFCAFAKEAIKAGHKHYSSDAVMHRIRWHAAVDRKYVAGESVKVNNNYTSRYARLFHRTYPKHAGFFRTRKTYTKAECMRVKAPQ